ncbi:MAG TPA: M20/M25/M40 family metallo-hydrolase [Nevskiaceae bacterium]|nr:M20/M25/M40 family metallo-hydrolase [Nevskiaceae bacterium]
MHKPPLELLHDFVNAPSPTGSERAFADHLHATLGDAFDYDHLEMQEVAPGRCNILMVKGDPAMMLTSHIDTVPTDIEPRIEDGIFYGTGACDAKGQIVAQLSAMQQARREGLQSYGCFYVIGEEVDSSGAQAVINHPLIRGTHVLNGEPTRNRFVNRSKGVVEASATAIGKEQHSSIVPFNSAIHTMITGLNRLIEDPHADATVNVGIFEGGKAANMSAAAAEAAVNLRITSDSEPIVRHTRDRLGNDISLKIVNVIEPYTFYVPTEYRADAIDVAYCSDAPYYAANFDHVMMFGPGDIAHAHNIHEQVGGYELADAARMIAHLLLRAQEGSL